MKKALRNYIFFIMLISSFLVIILNFFLYMNLAKNQQKKIYDNFFYQLTQNLDNIEIEQEIFEDNIKEDYIIRAKMLVNLILEDNSLVNNSSKLKEIANLLKADEIHITDEKGVIEGSTDTKYIGLDLNNYSQSKEFMFILDGDENSSLFQDIQINAVNEREMAYVGVKRLDSNGIVQLGIIPERLLQIRKFLSYSNIFENLLMEETMNIFAIDKESYEIITKSSKDEKLISIFEDYIENIDMNIDVDSNLNDYDNGKLVKIDKIRYFIITEEYEDLIICGISNYESIYNNVSLQMYSITVCIIVVIITVIIFLNKFLNKNVISDIYTILDSIKKIENGDYNTKIKINNNTELKEIGESINKMVSAITRTNKCITKIIELNEIQLGFFEYIKDLNHIFITDNVNKIINMSEEEWKVRTINKKECFTLLKEIIKNPVENEQNIYKLENDEYVKVILYSENSSSYGIVQNVTKEITEKKKILENLKEAEFYAKRDELTQLLNKFELKNQIEKYLKENGTKGAFILFDLDNFKRVNDTDGHPAGDLLLQRFAEKLKNYFNNEECIARLGGDEFAVFINSSINRQELIRKLENLIREVREYLEEYYTKYNVSVSIGALILYKDCNDFDSVYKKTDKALYRAKRNGKDQFYIT